MRRELMVEAVGVLALLLQATALGGQSAPVTITGGADASHHNYTWTITNHSPARIVYIEIPHYRADLFQTPDNWKQQVENPSHTGWQDRLGTCTAEPAPPYTGLPSGASAEFGMRIARLGALPGKGTVNVRFDDGTQASIADVELPTKPESGSAYLALIGSGLIFVLFIVYNERRRRRRAETAAPEEDV